MRVCFHFMEPEEDNKNVYEAAFSGNKMPQKQNWLLLKCVPSIHNRVAQRRLPVADKNSRFARITSWRGKKKNTLQTTTATIGEPTV